MIKLKSYAKINLGLHVIPKKLPNKLYPVKYVNCFINLYDEITVRKIKNKIVLISDHKELPKWDKNLIYKALNLLKKEAKTEDFGVKINLKKNIPIKAGFGGGSSNATSVLLATIKLLNLKISNDQVLKIANRLGKEVFYFLKGGLCEVLNDGTLVNKIPTTTPKIWIVAIGPKQKKLSTGYMFKNLDQKNIGVKQNKFNLLKKALIKNDAGAIFKNLHNDFESYALKKYKELPIIKKRLFENGAVQAVMTGAGLYIIGYFDKKQTAKKAYNSLRKSYKSIIFTHTK